MMNSDLLLASLRQLMNDYGEVVNIVNVSHGSYNVATGVVSSGSSQNNEVIGYFFNNHPSEAVASTVETGRKRLAVYAKKTDGTDLPLPTTEDNLIANLADKGTGPGPGAGPGPNGGDGLIRGSIVEVQTVRANGKPMVYLLRIET